MTEPTKPHDVRLIRVIQRIFVERLRGRRFTTSDTDVKQTIYPVRLRASQQLFEELFPRRSVAWLSFLREWTFRIGCGFRVSVNAEGKAEWWITRDEYDDAELRIPWYREAHFIEDVFAVLETHCREDDVN